MENYEKIPQILLLPQISPKSVLSGVASVIHENQYLSHTQKPPQMITFRNDRLKQTLQVRHKGSEQQPHPLNLADESYQTLMDEHRAIIQHSRHFGGGGGSGVTKAARDTYHYNEGDGSSGNTRKVVYKHRGDPQVNVGHWQYREDRGTQIANQNATTTTRLIRAGERMNIQEMLQKFRIKNAEIIG
jgi:hypothetical protein